MKWGGIQGNWTQLKGIARTQWGRLTGDYVGAVAGNRQQLLGKTQATRAITRNAEERQLAEWLAPASTRWIRYTSNQAAATGKTVKS